MPASECPSDDELLAFDRGELPPDRIDAIADHLEGCPRCEAAIERLESSGHSLGSALRGTPSLAEGGPSLPEPPPGESLGAGSVIGGRYKLVEAIGEGGMGSVFMAQQFEPVRRLVAIKLIKEGMDTRQVLARFEAERQALAVMDHPNIARVLDAGATPAGRPYFVMELVRGQPITRYCDENNLTTRERLDLFIPVCRAIQHAHQKGIIHRDIKPGNVLVAPYDGRPVPKVIDFGIAKAVGPALTDMTLVTNFGAVVGTPEYMSPEQAQLNQLDVDTRTDVYGLGVLLYELLTGTTPLERSTLRRAALLEILRLVREEDPPPPSNRLSSSDALPSLAARRGTEPRRLAALVRGDLDWITMRALEKDRNRRYETATALARDVERYLTDEPVEASPPTAMIKLRRWMRKHPTLMTTVAAAVIVGVVTLAVAYARETGLNKRLTNSLDETRKARIVADRRLDQALAAVEDYYTGVGAEVLLGQKEFEDLRERLLEKPRQFYERLAEELSTAPVSDTRSRYLLALGRSRLALIQQTLGHDAEAMEVYKASLAIVEELIVARPSDPTFKGLRAECLRNQGYAFRSLGQVRDAEEALNKALAAYTELESLRPGNPDDKKGLAMTYLNLGILLNGLQRVPEAEAMSGKAAAEFRALAVLRPDNPQDRGEAARNLMNLSMILTSTNRVPEAEETLREVVASYKALAALQPKNTEYKSRLANSSLRLAHLLSQMVGRSDEAERLLADSISLYQSLADLRPNDPSPHEGLAQAYGTRIFLLIPQQRYAEAEKTMARTLAEYRALIGLRPRQPDYRVRLVMALSSRANSLQELKQFDEAAEEYRKAIEEGDTLISIWKDIPYHHFTLATCYINLGSLQSRTGNTALAFNSHRRAFDILSDLTRNDPNDSLYGMAFGIAANSLGTDLRVLGRAEKAIPYHRSAIDTLKALHERTTAQRDFLSNLQDAYDELAVTLRELGKVDEAVESLKEWRKLADGDADELISVAAGFAECLPKASTPERKAKLADEAMDVLRAAVAAGGKDGIEILQNPAFHPLKDREDFRRLINPLLDKVFPPDPFAR